MSERLIYTDLEANNNKYWNAQVEGSQLILEWGRVGDRAQRTIKQFASEFHAQRELTKRTNAKLKDGYTKQHTLTATTATNIAYVAKIQIEHNNDKETEQLIDFLVQRNIHAIEGSTNIKLEAGKLTTPLGPVTNEGLDRAEQILNRMANVDSSASIDIAQLANEYLRIVPKQLGRTRTDPKELFGTVRQLQQEQAIIDSLRAVVRDAEQRTSTDTPIFQARLNLIASNDIDHSRINRLYSSSLNKLHQSSSLRLKRVWEMEIQQHSNEFEQQLGNIRELWHGSKDANLLSILKSGYIIPAKNGSIAINGRMYGDGIYFSDQSTKSLNYAGSFWGGSGSRRTFMLLNDVAMGREFMARSSFNGGCPKGYDSCFAKAGISGVRNNEMIVYRKSQIKPKWLCEFE